MHKDEGGGGGMNTYELVLLAGDIRDIHVVGRRAKIFEFLAGEDIDGDEMDFGVAVLAGLRRTHLNNLAGAALDDDEAVLPQGRALHWISGRGASIGALKGVLMLLAIELVRDELVDGQTDQAKPAGLQIKGTDLRILVRHDYGYLLYSRD